MFTYLVFFSLTFDSDHSITVAGSWQTRVSLSALKIHLTLFDFTPERRSPSNGSDCRLSWSLLEVVSQYSSIILNFFHNMLHNSSWLFSVFFSYQRFTNCWKNNFRINKTRINISRYFLSAYKNKLSLKLLIANWPPRRPVLIQLIILF